MLKIINKFKIIYIFISKQSLSKRDAKKGKKKPAFQVRDMKHTFISLDKAFEYIGDNSKY